MYASKICYDSDMANNTDQEQQAGNPKFSLGLPFVELADLIENQLDVFLSYASREEIIDWLTWNDPNGVYSDVLSLSEFGKIVSKEEGIGIIKRQIFEL